MALTPGTRFGTYEIGDSIGAGGMGEVYRATDTTLERDVAIKVLPESFAADANRVARFEREAKTLASLNHPNIAHIYGLERREETTALVMELVEGPTLAERIADGALAADEALGIATQIAEALEAAHGQSIVHRDLKPANIKVRSDGTVKVLDFGIAKALDVRTTSGPDSPALTTPTMTQAGIILGTAQYMSPEQARGKPVDQRADIWSFGCVLYEMLTGQPAFGGEDVAIILARVLDRDTDLNSVPAAISPAVRHTIKLCLMKEPKKRLHAMGDVRLALEGALESDDPYALGETQAVASPLRRALPIAATAAVAIAGTAVAVGLLMRPEPLPVNRFDYDLPEGRIFRFTGRVVMALSPDGRHFVYNGDDGFYLRTMGELEARIIPGTETDARAPSFSPDGQSIVYWDGATAQLKRIAISGGAPVVIGPLALNVHGLSWEEDGTILIGQPEGIYRVSADGGTPERIIEIEVDRRPYGARLLPDGDSVLFSVGPQLQPDGAQIVVQSLSTGERSVLVDGGNDARFLPTGHLVYALGDGLFAIAFDLDTLTVSGSPVPLAQGLLRPGGGLTGTANYGVSDDGTLVFVIGDNLLVERSLVWVDRRGGQEPLDVPGETFNFVQLSPDDSRVAFSTFAEGQDVWVWDVERATSQRLTFDPGTNSAPVWSPDGQRLAFSREVSGIQEIFWQDADGSGSAEPLTEGSATGMRATDLSADGTVLLYMSAVSPGDVWMVPTGGPPTVGEPLLASPADERSARLSPDGRWIAYQSDESGEYQIYVRPFPDVDTGRWQISYEGGSSPIWGPGGSELFYFDQVAGTDDAVVSVSVESAESFTAGTPEVLFRGNFPETGFGGAFYDVTSDGQRFLMIRIRAGGDISGEPPQIIIVENWFEELERLAPTN